MKWAGSTQDSEEPRLSIILKCIVRTSPESAIVLLRSYRIVYFNIVFVISSAILENACVHQANAQSMSALSS